MVRRQFSHFRHVYSMDVKSTVLCNWLCKERLSMEVLLHILAGEVLYIRILGQFST